jgi:tetratricopeptide (TPR) repeat protein
MRRRGSYVGAGRPFPDLQRVEHLYRQGKEFEDSGDNLAAVAFYEEALQIRPGSPTIWYSVGVIRGKLEGPEAAISYYDEALRLRPSYQEALCNKGVSLEALGRLDDALPLLQAATELDPEDPVAWWGRATVEERVAPS